VATAGFTALALRKRDELIAWFAIGLTLSTFSRLNYALFPSLSPEWVFTGDIFRIAFYLVLLVGALRELGTHQRSVANEAVIEERQRMARDLHDGLAQELAFLSRETHRLAEHSDVKAAAHLAEAADRALSESRQAIAFLATTPEQPLDLMISQAARQLTSRAGVELKLDLDPRADLPPDGRQALVRIVRESVWNGLRHGRATKIAIELSLEPSMTLRIRDNGIGFDPEAETPAACFGLMGIRERARALGGEAWFLSSPGKGTAVEVCLP
jgi:signal transduction histidine kinase